MKQRFVLAFIDLDDLKTTNDTLGHAAGDQRLRETADVIRGLFRPYDLIVRFGGDEFAIGLRNITIAETAKRFSLVNANLVAAHQAPITAGLAESEEGDCLEDLRRRADTALYDRKRRRSRRT